MSRDIPFRFVLSDQPGHKFLNKMLLSYKSRHWLCPATPLQSNEVNFLATYIKSIHWSAPFSSTVVVSIILEQAKSLTSARPFFEKDDSFQRKATMGLPVDYIFYYKVGNQR